MKVAAGFLVAFLIGVACRYFGIPSPAPPVIQGAALVVAMTLGFVLADRFLARRPHTRKDLCAGPSGLPPSRERL